jgi:hypothetical protein
MSRSRAKRIFEARVRSPRVDRETLSNASAYWRTLTLDDFPRLNEANPKKNDERYGEGARTPDLMPVLPI